MMHRRDFLKQCMLAAGSAAMSPVLGRTAPAMGNNAVRLRVGEKPPNIIFILADDLGYGDLSCLNPGSKISTPNLDRLASQGMVFTDAHSGSAVCTTNSVRKYGHNQSYIYRGIKADPGEQNNLYSDPGHQHIVNRLKALLEEYKTQGRSRPIV